MRYLPILLLLGCGTLLGQQKDSEKLQKLWDSAQVENQYARVTAWLAILRDPGAVEFLATKCQPVRCTAEQFAGWMKDLDNDDDKVRDAAIVQVRRHIACKPGTFEELFAECGTLQSKRSLAKVLCFERDLSSAVMMKFSVKVDRTGPGILLMHHAGFDDRGNELQSGGMRRQLIANEPHGYGDPMPETEALFLLRILGTAKALKVMKDAAGGHPESRTAIHAKELEDYDPTGLKWTEMEDGLPIECGIKDFAKHPYSYLAIQSARLTTSPDVVEDIVLNVKPIKSIRQSHLQALKDFASDDAAVWQPAYREFRKCHPLCFLTNEEILTACKDGRVGNRLLSVVRDFPLLQHDDAATLTVEDSQEGRTWDFNYPSGRTAYTASKRVEYYLPFAMHRIAILLLEHHGTKEAVAHLRKIAAEDADLLTTNDAKAALVRLGVR